MLRRESHCKINLLLNILGRRSDGYHDLETLFVPVPLTDGLSFELNPGAATEIELSCSEPSLPVDATNLVHRAATRFLAAAGLQDRRIRIHLEKRLPLSAGLGAGSANAAHTLLALNELFGNPLAADQLDSLAAGLGSDVNFFLQSGPALATGRGEVVTPIPPFDALRGAGLFLYHPGFGVSTAWAFTALKKFPTALNGRPGRAAELVGHLCAGNRVAAGAACYNSLESPVLDKYPVLRAYQEFLQAHGAWATLMSGSGSTTFALFPDETAAREIVGAFEARFGTAGWLRVVALS